MKERSFDEMVAYFNRRVSEMDIAQDYKMELLGMVTALGYKHEKTAQQWIPCSERLPEEGQGCLVCDKGSILIDTFIGHGNPYNWKWYIRDYEAWMPLPEPYAKKRWKFCIECGAKMDAMTTETREDVEPYGISSNSDTKLN